MTEAARGDRPRELAWLLAPSVVLSAGLLQYRRADSTSHFFLHMLMGWDVAFLVLLSARYLGHPFHRFDGLIPIAFVVYAQMPDFIYLVGPFHRDWMDIFLFHVALDEILPLGLVVLVPLWAALFLSYLRTLDRRGRREPRRIS
ncbi:MAG: hypothetical protein ACYDAR_19050 [Thermomicrobiales bacterium]